MPKLLSGFISPGPQTWVTKKEDYIETQPCQYAKRSRGFLHFACKTKKFVRTNTVHVNGMTLSKNVVCKCLCITRVGSLGKKFPPPRGEKKRPAPPRASRQQKYLKIFFRRSAPENLPLP